MSTKAKKLAKYSEFQAILGKELPINAARVKIHCAVDKLFNKSSKC